MISLCVLALSSCATAPSLENQIYVANQAITSIVGSTDAALNAHLITKQQAHSVSAIAHELVPLVDSARSAVAAGETASASKTMSTVNALLAGLHAYVPKAPGPEPPAPMHPDNR